MFEDANQSIIEFNEVIPKVLTEFKLQSDDLIDKSYLITYTITEIEDEDGFVMEENKIIKLEEINLEYNAIEGDIDEDEEN